MTYLLWVWVLFSSLGFAGLMNKPEDILRAHFGEDAKIESINVLLSEKEALSLHESSGLSFSDRIFTFFKAYKNEKLMGYAAILTRKVRSKDQTAVYLLTKEGQLEDIELVAFYEPPEYIPKSSWLEQFKGQKVPLKDVRAISGATLTTRSFTQSTKLVLSVWQHAFKKKRGG